MPREPDLGVGPDFVWVTRGCSGEFEVTGTGGEAGIRRMVCESRTAARVQCPVAGATAVRLVQQLSTNPCRLNQSFGLGLGHMWVSSGCRGEFEVVTGVRRREVVGPVSPTGSSANPRSASGRSAGSRSAGGCGSSDS